MVFKKKGQDNLDVVVNIRLTTEEKSRLQEDADLASMFMCELIRFIYFGLSVTIAQAKFGTTLTLTGSAAFLKSAVAAAIDNNLTCWFFDCGINALHDELIVQKKSGRPYKSRSKSWKICRVRIVTVGRVYDMTVLLLTTGCLVSCDAGLASSR